MIRRRSWRVQQSIPQLAQQQSYLVEDTPQHDHAAVSLPLFDVGPAVVRVGLPLYGQLC